MRKKSKFFLQAWFGVGFLSLFVFMAEAGAAGFALQEQSGRGLGQAFAGASTGFGDGSSVFFNPAAMFSDGEVASLSGNFVLPSSKFNNKGSEGSPFLGGSALGGGNGGDAGGLGFIPNFYLTQSVHERVMLGLGVNAPFGLGSEYDRGWVGRYHGVKSELLTINLNPSIAVKLSDHFFIGGGISVLYGDATLSQAIDFGTVGASVLGPARASALGLRPEASDGFSDISADDWGVGYSLGALAVFDKLKLGVGFRSKIDLSLSGDAEFTVPASASALTSTGAFSDGGAGANIGLPESVNFGASYEVSERLEIAFDALWTAWTRLEEIRVEFDAPVQPDSATKTQWSPSWRFAWGGNYKATDNLLVRSGIAWERTPITAAEFRTPRIPDDDRLWLTAGIGYDINDSFTVDVSYAHLFVGNANVNEEASTGQVLKGDYDATVDILSFELTYKL